MIHVATVEILMRFEETDAYDHVDLYQQDAITLILHQSAQCLIVSQILPSINRQAGPHKP